MALDTATAATPVALEPSERDAVLAGLRLLQLHNEALVHVYSPGDPLGMVDAIASENGVPLTNDRIDALCERINA